jgi:hypothetical protein
MASIFASAARRYRNQSGVPAFERVESKSVRCATSTVAST